jgi:hypothetical protein
MTKLKGGIAAVTIGHLKPGSQLLLLSYGWVRVNSVDGDSALVGWRGGTRVLTQAHLSDLIQNVVWETLNVAQD